jgi:hypothetical protein
VPEALALITTVGKKAILDAARDGLILRQEVGFADKLRVMPAWCNRLPPASTELTRQFDFSDTLGTLSIWDLWHRTRRAKYRRENF